MKLRILSGLRLIASMFDVSLRDTECISTFLIVHTVHCCCWLIVITLLLMVTVVTVITAFLYWRCCCCLSSDCLICEVNIQVNAGANQKLSILLGTWGGGCGLTWRLYLICVEFKDYVVKFYRYRNCNLGVFAAVFM